MSRALSVVIPVHNEAPHLRETIDALVEALERSPFAAQLVVVDDGSTDASMDVARDAARGRIPIVVVSQRSAGRFRARWTGIEHATSDSILLLDGRVRLRPESLAFVHDRLVAGEVVWNAHVHVGTEGNPYGAFSNVLVELAWREYFDAPRTTSYGADDFDRYPKGTGCFLAPRRLLLEASDSFWSRYDDFRHANDDTPMLRWIAERQPIHVSPSFACDYRPRATLGSFLQYSFHRGTVFLDGHGRPESRFFPATVAFFPFSACLTGACVRRPALVPALAAASAAAAAGTAKRAGRSGFEIAAFAALAPVYAVAHGAGMWRGLALLLRRSATGSSA